MFFETWNDMGDLGHEENEDEEWHDAQEFEQDKQTSRPFHLSVAHQTIAKGEKGRQHEVMFTTSANVDAMLGNMD